MNRLLFIALPLVLLTGCGPKFNKRVPGDVLGKLPYEARIELLESENDLALSVDRLDEANAEVMHARDQTRRAKDRLSAAEKEVGLAADPASKTVAELAVSEGQARVAWLRAKQQLNLKEVALAELGLRCAHTRFEQARLAAARKAKLEGSEKLDPKEFEEQVKACDAAYAEAKTENKEVSAAADAARAEWEKTRSALAKKTFDARASPFVE